MCILIFLIYIFSSRLRAAFTIVKVKVDCGLLIRFGNRKRFSVTDIVRYDTYEYYRFSESELSANN